MKSKINLKQREIIEIEQNSMKLKKTIKKINEKKVDSLKRPTKQTVLQQDQPRKKDTNYQNLPKKQNNLNSP